MRCLILLWRFSSGDNFEHIQSLKTNAEIIEEFPEWEKYKDNPSKLYELKVKQIQLRSRMETPTQRVEQIQTQIQELIDKVFL